MRGLLLDRGVTIGVSISRARRAIPMIIADLTNGLTEMTREIIAELYEFLGQIDVRIKTFDRRIEAGFRSNAACQRIARICGVGPKTATAVIAAVGDGAEFKNGRHLAAWMGLVPRQHSSGNRQIQMGISKRGDQHLRTLLVHGARSVVRVAAGKTDALSRWINALRERRGVRVPRRAEAVVRLSSCAGPDAPYASSADGAPHDRQRLMAHRVLPRRSLLQPIPSSSIYG